MKILFWQIFLGIVQYSGYYIGGKKGLLFALILVLFWTLTQTYSGLFVFQFLFQSFVAFGIYKYCLLNKKMIN